MFICLLRTGFDVIELTLSGEDIYLAVGNNGQIFVSINEAQNIAVNGNLEGAIKYIHATLHHTTLHYTTVDCDVMS